MSKKTVQEVDAPPECYMVSEAIYVNDEVTADMMTDRKVDKVPHE